MINLYIDGRRWFDSTFGNTYHTVQIRDFDRIIYTSDITYGYDNQYRQTAKEWLADQGYDLTQVELSFRVLDCPKNLLHNWRKQHELMYGNL